MAVEVGLVRWKQRHTLNSHYLISMGIRAPEGHARRGINHEILIEVARKRERRAKLEKWVAGSGSLRGDTTPYWQTRPAWLHRASGVAARPNTAASAPIEHIGSCLGCGTIRASVVGSSDETRDKVMNWLTERGPFTMTDGMWRSSCGCSSQQ